MNCQKCKVNKEFCDFFKVKNYTCLECKDKCKNKTDKPKKVPRLTQEQIYKFLKEKYNINESLDDIKKKVMEKSDE